MYDIFMIDPPWPKKKGGKRMDRENILGKNMRKFLTVKEIRNM